MVVAERHASSTKGWSRSLFGMDFNFWTSVCSKTVVLESDSSEHEGRKQEAGGITGGCFVLSFIS
eukprot:1484283-Amphidinium_carterae.1